MIAESKLYVNWTIVDIDRWFWFLSTHLYLNSTIVNVSNVGIQVNVHHTVVYVDRFHVYINSTIVYVDRVHVDINSAIVNVLRLAQTHTDWYSWLIQISLLLQINVLC